MNEAGFTFERGFIATGIFGLQVTNGLPRFQLTTKIYCLRKKDVLLNPNKIQISSLSIGVLNMPLGRTCYTLADSVPIAIEFQILIRRKKYQENQNEERFGAESNPPKLQGFLLVTEILLMEEIPNNRLGCTKPCK